MLAETFNFIIEESQRFTTALTQHLVITFIALGISIAIGLSLGVIGTRVRWMKTASLAIGNLGRTIPSLAVLALALPLLGIGTPPTLLALVFIGTLPILINTMIGIEQVDPNISESARGMGMNDLQVLLRVEVPIAIPIIMAGIRTSAVLVVASATLAAFIGGGGLGDLILQGHALRRDHVLLAGAIPATLLAFYFEEAFGRLESWATPKGLKIGSHMPKSGGLLALLASMTVLPLVFGVLLPWVSFLNADGDPVILTGLSPVFRETGLPVLLLGLIAALWPRRGENAQPWPRSLITTVPAIAGLVWMIIGLVRFISSLEANQGLQFGFWITLVAIFALAVITGLEMALGLRDRTEAGRAEPSSEGVPAPVSI
ncbi:MAG: ABC transporter permease [Anaerolineales bacterium]